MIKRFFQLAIIAFCAALHAQDSIRYPVFFDYRKAEIDSMEMKRLSTLIYGFSKHKILSISIQAFCDERGGKKINDPLSKNRAESIYTFLKIHPKVVADTTLLSHEGLGLIPIVGKNDIEKERAKNRRGDLLIYYKKRVEIDTTVKVRVKTPIKAPVRQKAESSLVGFFQNAKIGDKIKLKIFFEGGSSRLLKSSYAELDSLCSLLSTNKVKVKLAGHIYAEGHPPNLDGYDQDSRTNNLSNNRANRAKQYLITKGIEEKRIEAVGEAGRFPTGISPEADRRVEIEIISLDGG